MNSVQESKNELEAAIRYAENAISSAKQTIESMEFRQEMAKKQYSEQTGREQALEREVAELRDIIDRMGDDSTGDSVTIKQLNEEREMLEKNVKYLRDENERLKREKEASSGPCGCQAYRDLEEKVGDLESEVNALEQPEKPTMPVIPKAVAIAIFREGMAYGAGGVCDELDNATDIEISDRECMGNFEVEYTQYVDLSDHLDTDYLRSKAVDNSDEEWVVDCLKTLCADNKFECRIHGVDDQEEKKND